ncbi:MAG: hypothetical protein JWN61_2659 [Pseudonocardiales bacterium]|nr:hypothetical protein [Pseudonocardiales bacterium]
MNLPVQHLSDEAIAACADGVLPPGAQVRAERHIAMCINCSDAVHGQREAMRALRTSVAPALPMDLLDRLRSLPMTTPLRLTPVVLGDGGAPMFAAYGTSVLAAADPGPRTSRGRFGSRSMMLVGATTALAVGFVGAGTGAVPAHSSPAPPAQRTAVTPTQSSVLDSRSIVSGSTTTDGVHVIVRETAHASLRAPADSVDRLPGAR